MQTFLPYADFAQSAATLDRARLGKQRVEAAQLLMCIAGFSSGWANHPAVRMWEKHALALSNYGHAVVAEWRSRGYVSNIEFALFPDAPLPPWLGNERLHLSHQSNLKRKDPVHYAQFEVPDNLPYWWPTHG